MPYRVLTMLRYVTAPLAFCFNLAAIAAKLRPMSVVGGWSQTTYKAICTVPPAPYHQAAARPLWYVAVEETRRVALQVQAEVIEQHTRPGFILREATANSIASEALNRVKRL